MVLITAFRGFRRGLFGVIYGIMTWALILALLPETVVPARRVLEKDPQLRTSIEKMVEPYVGVLALSALTGSTSQSSSEIDANEVLQGTGLDGLDINSLLGDSYTEEEIGLLQRYFQNFAGTEEYLDEYEKKVLGEGDSSASSSESVQADLGSYLSENMSDESKNAIMDKIVDVAFSLLAIALGYLVIKVIVVFIGMCIKLAMHKRDRSSTDNILGIIWGAVEGVLYICVFLAAISLFEDTGVGKVIANMVNTSTPIRIIYDYNFLTDIIRKMIVI
jgi:uncharacterized membrane protein required for colicin V production